MSASLISSLRALSLRTKPATRLVPTLCRQQSTVRSISQSALAPTQAWRPAITRPAAAMAMVQQQMRGMKVHSSVKKRCEHCKVSRHPKLRTLSCLVIERDKTLSIPCIALNPEGLVIV
ncbi:hypothetical protein CIB48_g1214 [Xylaria polymorpha]|nr:hypothetical protein CIB48_g1214 [Xylaria polymorpha]